MKVSIGRVFGDGVVFCFLCVCVLFFKCTCGGYINVIFWYAVIITQFSLRGF